MFKKALKVSLIFLILSCSESSSQYDYVKTYEGTLGEVTLSVDSLAIHPAERLTVILETSHKEAVLPKIEWTQTPALTLLEEFKTPNKWTFRFDSNLPGQYLIPALKVSFDDEIILTDEVNISVYSMAEGEKAPQEILPIKENQVDPVWVIFFVIVALFLFLLLVLFLLVRRYFRLKKRLNETIKNQRVEILSSLREAVAQRFESLKPDQIALLILQTVVVDVDKEGDWQKKLVFFTTEQIMDLRQRVEKYQRVAFGRNSVTQYELIEDLNFFINFQKQLENIQQQQESVQ